MYVYECSGYIVDGSEFLLGTYTDIAVSYLDMYNSDFFSPFWYAMFCLWYFMIRLVCFSLCTLFWLHNKVALFILWFIANHYGLGDTIDLDVLCFDIQSLFVLGNVVYCHTEGNPDDYARKWSGK